MNYAKSIAQVLIVGVIVCAMTLVGVNSAKAKDATAIFTGHSVVTPRLGVFMFVRYTPEGKPFMVEINGFSMTNRRAVNVDNVDQEIAEAEAWIKDGASDAGALGTVQPTQ